MIKSIVLQRQEGEVAVRYDEAGEGRLYLLLHGGAGPKSMSGLADALAGDGKVVLPTHPGFDGQVRPDWLSSIRQLAEIYVDFVERQGAHNVTVIGSSVGGWIAAEMSLLAPSRISRLVLLNAVGIDPDPHGKPIVDRMTLP
ncbi:MAG: alpha/beta fold hydrolase, partial [Rhizobium sp.]